MHLAFASKKWKTQADVWNGVKASDLYVCMKIALKSELARQCLNFAKNGLSPEVIEDFKIIRKLPETDPIHACDNWKG